MQNYSVEMLPIKQLLLFIIVTDSLLIYHVKLSIQATLFSGVFFLVAEEIGCFNDRNLDRKMGLIFTYQGKVPWKNLWKVVGDCSREAKKKK